MMSQACCGLREVCCERHGLSEGRAVLFGERELFGEPCVLAVVRHLHRERGFEQQRGSQIVKRVKSRRHDLDTHSAVCLAVTCSRAGDGVCAAAQTRSSSPATHDKPHEQPRTCAYSNPTATSRCTPERRFAAILGAISEDMRLETMGRCSEEAWNVRWMEAARAAAERSEDAHQRAAADSCSETLPGAHAAEHRS